MQSHQLHVTIHNEDVYGEKPEVRVVVQATGFSCHEDAVAWLKSVFPNGTASHSSAT